MPDYKKMYLRLFRASEEAINLLIQAQRECEALYVDRPEPELTLVLPPPEEKKSPGRRGAPSAPARRGQSKAPPV